MVTALARDFRGELGVLQAILLGLPPGLADTPWRTGGWTRKQIVGHLLDSAANNRQRFVRAAAEGRYAGPKYAQDAWVAAHGYAEQDWETLLRWWQAEHEILAAVVDRIPEDRLGAECVVGDDAPVTLRFLIEDYLEHQRWHFAQLTGGLHPTEDQAGEFRALSCPRRASLPQETPKFPPVPADDLSRNLRFAAPNTDETLPHIGLVGDTYTITVSGDDTNGRFCVIDMHIPPGGGPPPHRHDFEETFVVLEGEMEATFRGKKSSVRAGETVNIPANAPHQFHNATTAPVRMLCICSPAGNDKFFLEVGVPVATRTTPAPKLDAGQQAHLIRKAVALAPKYRTELLKEA